MVVRCAQGQASTRIGVQIKYIRKGKWWLPTSKKEHDEIKKHGPPSPSKFLRATYRWYLSFSGSNFDPFFIQLRHTLSVRLNDPSDPTSGVSQRTSREKEKTKDVYMKPMIEFLAE